MSDVLHDFDSAPAARLDPVRVERFLSAMLAGTTQGQVIAAAVTDLGLTADEARRYVDAARASMCAQAGVADPRVAEHVLSLRQIRVIAMKEGKLDTALRAQQEEVKLLGLYDRSK